MKFSWVAFVNKYLYWLPWQSVYYLQSGYKKPVCWIKGCRYDLTIPLCSRCNSFKKNDPNNFFTNGGLGRFLIERYAGDNPDNKPGKDTLLDEERYKEKSR